MENQMEGALNKEVKVGAKISLELHLAAKNIYQMQGTTIGERLQDLLRKDLKKEMSKKWFKEMPEAEVGVTKWLVEMDDRKEKKKAGRKPR